MNQFDDDLFINKVFKFLGQNNDSSIKCFTCDSEQKNEKKRSLV
jgi:hypothetical protein